MTAMALTKRQKTLLAVFFLGLFGLGVDHVFLRPRGGPDATSADSPDDYAVPLSPAPHAPSPAAEAPDPGMRDRLAQVWPDQKLNAVEARDPFSLAGSWSDGNGTGPSAVQDSQEAFARAHPLAAVVFSGQQSYISIDDRILKLGEQIEGYILVSIGPKSAVFERQGERIVLELSNK